MWDKRIYRSKRGEKLTGENMTIIFDTLRPFIPKAAWNILGSGFSYPTSEDIMVASNLR